MKALILAAGRGRRLQQSEPKPLTSLLGLTLLERVLFSLKQKGIAEAIIVTGYKGDTIIKKLKDKEKKIGIKLTFIENPEWEKGNGVSVLKAKRLLEKHNFILLMCDHLFDPEILEKLPQKAQKCAVCIDRDLSNIFDMDDATKIYMEQGVPKRIGKSLEKYNAIDCGIFYCTPEIFSALEKTTSEGKYQLTDAVQYLVERGRMDAIDITGKFWIDIDTPESLKHAERQMLRNLTKPTDGIVSKIINRRISKLISSKLVKTGITPNQVSLFAFMLMVISSILFASGRWTFLVIGGMLVQISSIIDGCDGEIARLKFQMSRYGSFLDSTLDRYADFLVIFGLAYGYWRLHEDFMVWILGFFALIGVFAFSYINARYEAVFHKESASLPLRRDLRLLVIAVGAIVNQVLITLLLLSLTNIEVFRRLISFRRESPAV